VCDLAAVELADRHPLDPVGTLGVVRVGVVDREQDAVGADGEDRVRQRVIGKVAAGGDPYVVGEVLGQAVLDLRVKGIAVEHVLGSPQQGGQALTQVTEDQLGAREPVEVPAEQQPYGVRGGLGTEAPGGALHLRMAFV
jgi:hypothetical protein